VLFIFLLGVTLLFSVPEVTDARPQVLEVEPTNRPVKTPILERLTARSWDPDSLERLEILWQSKPLSLPDSSPDITKPADIDPFGTPHAPIYIDDNSDFETLGFSGEGTVIDPYLISGLNINSTINGVAAINITNTDVHFFIMHCWLTANDTTVIVFDSVSHGRIWNNTILDSERGVATYHSDDLTIFDNLFYSFSWTGVYMEDCTLSTLENNNCTTCFVGLHIEQSDNIFVEDNYCINCLGAIELYYDCQSVTVYNNTVIGNDVGIGLYLNCAENIVDSNYCTDNMFAGIYSENCQDNDILNNFGRLNYIDVYLVNSTSHDIRNNDLGFTTFSGGMDMYGSISLHNSNNSIIVNNHVNESFISINIAQDSSFNEVVNNTCFVFAGGVVAWFGANNTMITNNTCMGGGIGEVGIYVAEASFCSVIENQCNQSLYNIAVQWSLNTEVVDNFCELSYDGCIIVETTYDSLIQGNTLQNGSTAIAIINSEYASILSNNISNYTGTFTGGLTGIHLDDVHNSTVEGNHLTKCSEAIYLGDSSKNNITDNTCIENINGIIVDATCYDVIIEDNYCHLQQGYAIAVVESFNCTVIRNTCTNTSGLEGVCLLLGDCEVDALWNYFSLSEVGMTVMGCDGVISHNTIKDNELLGIDIGGIIGPNVTWNTFEDNVVNARDDSSSTLFDYNYWSNYTGIDSNGDGIGDIWHPIQGTANNNDTHPLVYHPTLPDWVEDPSNQDAEYGQLFSYSLSTTTSTILAPIVDWWISDTTNFEIDDGTITNTVDLDYTTYPLEVRAVNLYGFELSGTFTVTVVDTMSPVVVGPEDFSFTLGATGFTINWTLNDAGPVSYSITVDSSLNESGTWTTDGQVISFDIDALDLDVGTHIIVITVMDIGGNTASDSVMVTVTQPPSDMTPLLLVLGAGGVVVVVIVVYVMRKKGTAE
jgi:parallel beta-helix repeat protein